MAYWLKTSGVATVAKVEPDSAKGRFTLKEMQKMVGGYIEILHLSEHLYLVINEEGRLRKLPENEIATFLHMWSTGDDAKIVGDAVLATRQEVGY